MRRNLLFVALGLMVAQSAVAQTLVSEKLIPLDKEQRKHEPVSAMLNEKTGGVTVLFESEKAKKEKGEKRTWQRYELTVDQELNVKAADYVTLGTKHSVKPKLYFRDFRIGHVLWSDEDGKVDMMMVQFIKFDNENRIVDVVDLEVCAEKEFDSYRVASLGDEIILMVQYESKEKETKGLDFVRYYRINANTLQVQAESDLNLLGKNEFGLEEVMAYQDNLYLVGKELQRIKPFKWKFPKSFILFKLDLNGKELARTNLTLPTQYMIGTIMLAANGNEIIAAGEYNPANIKPYAPSAPMGSKTVKASIPFKGLFFMKYDLALSMKTQNVYDYEKDVLKKIKKGNPGFSKKGGTFLYRDFYFLPDGSLYLTAEMFVKYWRTTVSDNGTTKTYYYYTDFVYEDGVIYKFTPDGQMDWLVQVDRDKYTLTYRGHLKSIKPIEPGKLDSYLHDGNELAVFYNTAGGKYGKRRFGLSGIDISADGSVSGPVDFTSDNQFGQLEGGVIQVDANHIIGIGTDKKGDNLWFKKIKFSN